MSARQFVGWMRYHAINPWDEWRGDLRAGIVAAAAVSPYVKKGRQVKPENFMPRFGAPRRRAARAIYADFMAKMQMIKGHGKGRKKSNR